MKQETKEAAEKVTLAIGGTVGSWSLAHISEILSVLVGSATLIYILVQLGFLVRKWYLLEKNKWNYIHTSPGELDEQVGKDSGHKSP